MSYMQHVNFIPAHSEQNPILVLTTSVKNLPHLGAEELALRGEWTAFGKDLKGTDCIVNAVEPVIGSFRISLRQPRVRCGYVLLRRKVDDYGPPLHFLR